MSLCAHMSFTLKISHYNIYAIRTPCAQIKVLFLYFLSRKVAKHE
jgi:hypothetical protein